MTRNANFAGNSLSLITNTNLPAPPATLTSPIATGFKGLKAITLFLVWTDGGAGNSEPTFTYTFSEFNPDTQTNELFTGMVNDDLDIPTGNVSIFNQLIDISSLSGGAGNIVRLCWEVWKPAAANNFSCSILETGDAANPGIINSLFVKGSVY